MKRERKLVWGVILFCIGTAVLLLASYYWWQLSYRAAADAAAAELLTNDLFATIIRYFGYILGSGLVISALYIILSCL